jgi:hypothetical protein
MFLCVFLSGKPNSLISAAAHKSAVTPPNNNKMFFIFVFLFRRSGYLFSLIFYIRGSPEFSSEIHLWLIQAAAVDPVMVTSMVDPSRNSGTCYQDTSERDQCQKESRQSRTAQRPARIKRIPMRLDINLLGFVIGLIVAVPLAIAANLLTPRTQNWLSTRSRKKLQARIRDLQVELKIAEECTLVQRC